MVCRAHAGGLGRHGRGEEGNREEDDLHLGVRKRETEQSDGRYGAVSERETGSNEKGGKQLTVGIEAQGNKTTGDKLESSHDVYNEQG